MRVVIDDAVFAGTDFVIEVLQLFRLALEGRHRVVVDEDGPDYQAWVAALGRKAQEECNLALQESAEAEVREPARREVRVVRKGTNWNASPPQAAVSDALLLLQRAFRVLVENSRNDWRFLLAMAKPEQRAELERRKGRDWLIVENGGGITNMRPMVLDWRGDRIARLTSWVLFDSDARRPGQPSGDAMKLRKGCGAHIKHHMLERRAIENYVTRHALEHWGKMKGTMARVRAFYSMPNPHQRSFFNMKGGFKDDEASAEKVAEDLYGQHALAPALRQQLAPGFGTKLRDVFGDGHVRTADLIEDGSFTEMNGAVTELLAWMR